MASRNIQNDGEIDDSGEVLKLLDDICLSEKHSDVTFVVENNKIPAHKTILMARSPYFVSLICGDFVEANQAQIELKVPLDAFKAILKYIYTGRLSVATLDFDEIVEILDLAEQYGLDTLKNTTIEYLTANLTLDNCVVILAATYLYSVDYLQETCMDFMDHRSIELLNHETFKTLPVTPLCALLGRDTFYAPEIDIFNAICSWSANKPNADIKEALSTVRWSELSSNDLLNVICRSNILDRDQLSKVMEGSLNNKNCRTPCKHITSEDTIQVSENDVGKNIATAEYGARTISGENPSNLLDGNFTEYSWRKGSTFHLVDTGASIIVDLGKLTFINYIKMLLMDMDSCSYSYHIDVSLDNKDYITVFDRRDDAYRSWQHVFFQSRPVRFIKLVGTKVISTKVYTRRFDVVGLQAIYKTIDLSEWIDDVLKPKKNVAKIEYGAVVCRGTGDGMLNENPNEYTCQEVGSSILLQLNQPYYIETLRMYLGNGLNHLNKYSFCIETSMNKSDWQMAVDKRNESLAGWLEFDFEPRPAEFIKITGTQRNINLICPHFECPRNPGKTILTF